MATRQSQWVVRAGRADWRDLQAAYTYDRRVKVYGFSVQFAAGVSWQELVRLGQFPHTTVCYAERVDLERAVFPLGYTLLLVASSGRGNHYELTLIITKNGAILDTLPDDAARALSAIFQQHNVSNP